MSDIQFSCPKCGHNLVVDAAGAGMSVPCPECNEPLVIPGLEEQPTARTDNANAGVGLAADENAAHEEKPLRPPHTSGHGTKLRAVTSVAARIMRLLFSWLAMVICLIGWLVSITFRRIVLVPILKVMLAIQYRKTGILAYQDKIGGEKAAAIFAQISAILANKYSNKSMNNGMTEECQPKWGQRLVGYLKNIPHQIRVERLFYAFGKELIESGEAEQVSMTKSKQAIKTKKWVDRLWKICPKPVGYANAVIGVISTLVILLCVSSHLVQGREKHTFWNVPVGTGDTMLNKTASSSNTSASESSLTGKSTTKKQVRIPTGYRDCLTEDEIAWGSKPEQVQRVFGSMILEIDGPWYSEQNPNATTYIQRYSRGKMRERIFKFDAEGLFEVFVTYDPAHIDGDEMINIFTSIYGPAYENYEEENMRGEMQKNYHWRFSVYLHLQFITLMISKNYLHASPHCVMYFDGRSLSRGRNAEF